MVLLYNCPMAVYFYYGEEDYNIDLAVEKLKSKLNPDFLTIPAPFLIACFAILNLFLIFIFINFFKITFST